MDSEIVEVVPEVEKTEQVQRDDIEPVVVDERLTDEVHQNTIAVEQLSAALQGLSVQEESTSGETVEVVSDEQWERIDQYFTRQSSALAWCLWCNLLLLLVVSVILGSRLFDTFSRGYRR